jgi:CRISPR-associated endonuclease Csn1
MFRIFGFDIGTSSIGSAVIDYDPARGAGDILWLAVRIFPEARDPDGTPLNQSRRTKRLIRRQFRRRRQRRRALNEALFDASLLPAYGSAEWQAVMALEPLALRSRGLSERLEPHELGRALYHLAKRRHFKERDLAEVEREDAAEETKIRRDADSFTAELRARGLTIGQLLFSETSPDNKNLRRKMLAESGSHKRARGVHFHRSDVADEFDRMVTAQAAFYPVLSDSDLRAHIENVVFAQRPVFWRRNALGRCRLVPGEPRARRVLGFRSGGGC